MPGKFGLTPEALTADHVRGMPLHDVTDLYGTLGLMLRLKDTLEATGLDQEPEVQWATQFGLMLHANDRRTNGHYADHILRVTLRAIEHYGVIDPAVAASCMMHDGVEDHAKYIVYVLAKEEVEDEARARSMAFELLEPHMGDEAVGIVKDVTNPIVLPGQDKDAIYTGHVKDIVANKPKARVDKTSDFTDNAVGNHHTIGPKQVRADEKYVDHYQIYRAGLFMQDSLITGLERIRALEQLSQGHARALARIAMNTEN